MAKITHHARKRFKQRLGVHKVDTPKNAKRALKEGLSQADVYESENLRRFMAALWFRNRTCGNIRLYNGMTYIFAGDTLITVFPIPDRFRDEAEAIQEERRNEKNVR